MSKPSLIDRTPPEKTVGLVLKLRTELAHIRDKQLKKDGGSNTADLASKIFGEAQLEPDEISAEQLELMRARERAAATDSIRRQEEDQSWLFTNFPFGPAPVDPVTPTIDHSISTVSGSTDIDDILAKISKLTDSLA